MPGSNNDYIQNEFWKEEVEIVDMDGSNITKTHTRTVEITRALDQPTLLLSKKGKVRERLQFINVYELEIYRPSNLIQLVCSNEEIVTLRVKSRDSLERWLDHLRKSLPMDSRGNSSDHFRGRAATENHMLKGQHSKTPRGNAEVQSMIFPERTIISPPTNAQNLMEPLAEDGYEIPSAFASLRSNDVYPRSTDQQPIYQVLFSPMYVLHEMDFYSWGAPTSNHGNSDLHAVVSFEIKIGSTKKPQPPPKPDSRRRCHPPNGNDANQGSVAMCGWNTSNRDICLPNKELVNELRSVVSNKSANSGDKHTPSIRANRPSYRPRPAMRLPIEETTDEDYDTLAAPCVSNGNAAADRRQASRRAPEDRLRIKPASEDQEPSSSSSSDESDESLYENVGNSIISNG
ncbi:hypothetical protein BSL78_04509 [Apostichopus japonicus]|uniref:PH domain-containing protein n=1 Tax=Stichopus japonicus TaxID=307972 RepID=A0A2G8LEE2_STIJA|nr:hypothetical protein BSL78_04509 [Apostichopus japonicus]